MDAQQSFLDSIPVHPHADGTRSKQAVATQAPMTLMDLVAQITGEATTAGRCADGAMPSWAGDVVGLSPSQLAHMYGLSTTGAERLSAAVEFHRRLLQAQRPERPVITRPEDVEAFMGAESLLDHERFWCLPLDPRSRLIGAPITVSMGDIDGTEAAPRPFFRAALRAGAASAIAVHNHPSGLTSPSPADLQVSSVGKALGLVLADHCIIAAGQPCHSLRRSHPSLF